VLRKTNTILAYLFFFTFLAHFGVVLFQTLVVRDGVIKRMVLWNIRPHASSPVEKGANHELR
jgi:cytochrome b561